MILEWLHRFGYLNNDEYRAAKSAAAGVIEFTINALLPAVRHHLGLPDDVTPEQLVEAPRCGCPDVMPLNVEQARWRKRDLTWQVRSYLPTSLVPQSVQEDVFAEGFRDWSSKIDVNFKRVTGNADITIFASPIDGPGRILAQAQLPNGSDSPLWLQLDSGEQTWSILKGSREANLLNVFLHELGHIVGNYHHPDRRALMYAMANSNITSVTELDVAASLNLGYSRRIEVPTPDPIPTPVPTPVPGGLMNLFQLLRKLLQKDIGWSERIALIGDLFKAFADAFGEQGPPSGIEAFDYATEAPDGEITMEWLEQKIESLLPAEGVEQLGDGTLVRQLWPLVLKWVTRWLSGL